MRRSNRLISLLSGGLVTFLALAAFRLSFDALRDLAAANGIDPGMAWLYPAIIDGAIIIFSLSVLQAGLNRERTRYPWALVGLFTLLSIVLNILHAPTPPLSRLLAAVPPIALFLSFELLMSQVKQIVNRLGHLQSLRQLETAVQQKRADLDTLVQEGEKAGVRLHVQLDKLTAKKEALLVDIKALKSEKRLSNSGIGQINENRSAAKETAQETMLAYLSSHPQASLSDIAGAIGRSRSTAGNYVHELTDNGRLHKNGHGWEVTRPG